MKLALRKRTFQDLLNDTPDDKLEVIFSGTPEQCKEYAEFHGFVWKPSPKYLFGGWWYKNLPTHVTEKPWNPTLTPVSKV